MTLELSADKFVCLLVSFLFFFFFFPQNISKFKCSFLKLDLAWHWKKKKKNIQLSSNNPSISPVIFEIGPWISRKYFQVSIFPVQNLSSKESIKAYPVSKQWKLGGGVKNCVSRNVLLNHSKHQDGKLNISHYRLFT